MADLYASPMGTCVLQNTTVPVRPTEEYGRVFVCGLASPDGAKEAIESMLSRFGAVVAFKRVESERVRLAAGADFEVRFESHQCAVDAVRASQIAGDTHFDRTAVVQQRGWVRTSPSPSPSTICAIIRGVGASLRRRSLSSAFVMFVRLCMASTDLSCASCAPAKRSSSSSTVCHHDSILRSIWRQSLRRLYFRAKVTSSSLPRCSVATRYASKKASK